MKRILAAALLFLSIPAIAASDYPCMNCLTSEAMEELKKGNAEAKKICTQAFSDSELLSLFEKVPIPEDGPITESMLNLDRRPTAKEKAALHVYYVAHKNCLNAWSNAILHFQLYIGATINEVDDMKKAHQKSNEHELNNTHLLAEGKLTFAEYNSKENQRREDARVEGKKGYELMLLRKNYQANIKAWLDPFKSVNAKNLPWQEFYKEAIEIAQEVKNGKIEPQIADKMIEDKRLALNQSMDKAKRVTLNCTSMKMSSSNKQLPDSPVTIDFTKSTVNGVSATINEDTISWATSTKEIIIINRLSGFISIGTDQFPALITGHCAPAQRQF